MAHVLQHYASQCPMLKYSHRPITQWTGLREHLQEPYISWGKPWFPVDFPVNESIEYRICKPVRFLWCQGKRRRRLASPKGQFVTYQLAAGGCVHGETRRWNLEVWRWLMDYRSMWYTPLAHTALFPHGHGHGFVWNKGLPPFQAVSMGKRQINPNEWNRCFPQIQKTKSYQI